ncbi:MAG: hypothetical protein JWN44_6858 [Myxococcales bacterium]|nr:hypothetical protein [Myxococcales bacterium]
MFYPKLPISVLCLLAWAVPARAATFVVTIKNTSTAYMAQGVLTLSPLISVGPSPNRGTPQWATYEYSRNDCNDPDSNCAAGANFTCWFGNSQTLVNRWGLTPNVNAWIPQPPSNLFGYTVFAPGDSATITFNASPGQTLSYITKAGDFSTYIDEIVMMHAPGSAGTLGVPLFDAAGNPLSNIAFELGGYDVSSTSPTDGTSPQCANFCPATGNPTGCYVALGSPATGALLPAQPATGTFTNPWTYVAAAGYTTDGLALGNLASATGNELVVSQEGAGAMTNPMGFGRAVVLNGSTGAALSTFNNTVVNHDFLGFPMIENVAATTLSQYFVSEFAQATPAPGAAVYARNGDSTSFKTSTNYGFPGMWNMGPSAGDVRSDQTGNEVVIADYNGDIQVLKNNTFAPLNAYNLFAQNSDHIYGHAAIGNVHSTAGNEIVVAGANTGKIYVFSAPLTTGAALTLLYTSAAPLNGGVAFGSGPAIGDIDGDGVAEVVMATGGGKAGVYAYNPNGAATCKYKWSTPGGADYSWTSPVIADVDGDGRKEVIVFSSNSVLSVLKATAGAGCVESQVAWTYTVGTGGPAWFTPVVANLVGSSALDIVVANYTTLEVVDFAQKGPPLRFTDTSAQFYPTAVVEAGANNAPGASLYVSGWSNGKVYKLQTPTGFPVAADWPTFMGGNTRTGAR